MKNPSRTALSANMVNTHQLNCRDKETLWKLFSTYYESVTQRQFLKDLSNKQSIILLREKKTRTIQGFSTIECFFKKFQGKNIQILYSGDTIVAKNYWGQSKLQVQFALFAMRLKLKRPLTPIYWFLISKGYKTYLLLSRNFSQYWPRPDQEMPKHIQDLLDDLAMTKFGNAYNKTSRVLRFPQCLGKLKETVSPIEPHHLKSEDIAFFLKKNPGHREGNELCCLSKIQCKDLLRYLWKAFRRKIR